MLVCTICGITVNDLEAFQIVRIGNRSTITIDKDGLAHNFTRTQDPTAQSLNAVRVNHERFHTAKNIVNPSCSLCILKSKEN